MAVSEIGFGAATFTLSVVKLNQMPPDCGAEVAFAGRSNAGKSSAINALTGLQGLARSSKAPGRTSAINFFTLDDERRRLVDLPGYGFARVPVEVKRRWGALVEGYLNHRRSLAGVVALMDVRRPFTDSDEKLVAWCRAARVPVLVTLSKADKVSRGKRAAALRAARAHLAASGGEVEVQLFSALHGTGLGELRGRLSDWLLRDTAEDG